MKRYLLLLTVLFCFSCSSEEDEAVEEEFKEWIVFTKNACDRRDSTINNEYCVTEETYNAVLDSMDENCDEFTFQDINGNEVTSLIDGVAESTRTESTSNCQ